MLSSFGIRAYRIFIESFLAWAFNNSIFIIHHRTGLSADLSTEDLSKLGASVGRGSDTFWQALVFRKHAGAVQMSVAAGR